MHLQEKKTPPRIKGDKITPKLGGGWLESFVKVNKWFIHLIDINLIQFFHKQFKNLCDCRSVTFQINITKLTYINIIDCDWKTEVF